MTPRQSAMSATQADILTPESAIAYVHSTFAGSFDSIVPAGCYYAFEDNMPVFNVTVRHGDCLSVATVWIEPGYGIYGEL